jgi:hypothetical protein
VVVAVRPAFGPSRTVTVAPLILAPALDVTTPVREMDTFVSGNESV